MMDRWVQRSRVDPVANQTLEREDFPRGVAVDQFDPSQSHQQPARLACRQWLVELIFEVVHPPIRHARSKLQLTSEMPRAGLRDHIPFESDGPLVDIAAITAHQYLLFAAGSKRCWETSIQ